MMPATRPMVPSDRAAALAALGDPRTFEQPNVRTWTDDRGGFITMNHGPGHIPKLGAVVGARGRRARYELVLAACEGALDTGAERGSFTVIRATMLTDIERSFNVAPVVLGELDGKPVIWEITVDLADARQQLLAWLRQ